jgi:formylglycine-generating enzyme required for sulfatase activity
MRLLVLLLRAPHESEPRPSGSGGSRSRHLVLLGALSLATANGAGCSQPSGRGHLFGPATLPGSPSSFVNTLGMEMVRIPAGSFLMGSPETEQGRYSGEGPQHEVTITNPFYMSACEVTESQYGQVMGTNPSEFQGASRPVDSVSWSEAVAFCEALSRREGREYRLPTEAEWEYACRAGSGAAYCFGNDSRVLHEYAWYNRWLGDLLVYMKGFWGAHPVGKKKPNAWGLYDMHGNVAEWCRDWYGPYSGNPRVDPSGPRDGRERAARGGTWGTAARDLRSAMRGSLRPSVARPDTGFRVVCEAPSGGALEPVVEPG